MIEIIKNKRGSFICLVLAFCSRFYLNAYKFKERPLPVIYFMKGSFI
jgi:hypothetical protein